MCNPVLGQVFTALGTLNSLHQRFQNVNNSQQTSELAARMAEERAAQQANDAQRRAALQRVEADRNSQLQRADARRRLGQERARINKGGVEMSGSPLDYLVDNSRRTEDGISFDNWRRQHHIDDLEADAARARRDGIINADQARYRGALASQQASTALRNDLFGIGQDIMDWKYPQKGGKK